MKCPRCASTESIKDGIIKGKQRYKCKKCNYHFTPKLKIKQYSFLDKKSVAVKLNQEGFSLRTIAEKLNVSHSTVNNWLKEKDVLLDNSELKVMSRDALIERLRSKNTLEHKGFFLIDLEDEEFLFIDPKKLN